MMTAPVQCSTNDDCSEIAKSECVDVTCNCVSGYVIVVGDYDVTTEKWRRGCRRRKLFEVAPACRGDADCEAAVLGSYCDGVRGWCLCRAGFVAGRSLNASCARLSASTCSTDFDCSDAIPDTRCDATGSCQCDVRMADDGTGTACARRPIGGFCRADADCTVPGSHCGSDARCECTSGFYADTASPACVRRRVGSTCRATLDCSDAFTGSDCVRGACACRPEFRTIQDGSGCQRRRIDDDDAVCSNHSDCATTFVNSVCGGDLRCWCLSGYRPNVERIGCVKRRRLSDPAPCRDEADCSDAIPNSGCELPTRRCACPAGFRADRTTSGGESRDLCRRRIVGDRCSADVDCSAILSAACDTIGVCACVTGYGIPTSGGDDCYRRRVGGEVGCETDRDCWESIQFSFCHDVRCSCLLGYMDVDNGTTCARRKTIIGLGLFV